MDLTIFYIFTFILGTIIGSFLNVVILRYNTGRGIGGRSMCFSCSTPLRWYNMVPVVSYLWQQGKCAFCSVKFSSQYPIVEVLTGFVFLLISERALTLTSDLGMVFGAIPATIFYFIIFSILIVISVYDYKHKIIPDGLVISFILLALARIIANYYLGADILWDLISGIAISLFFASLWYFSDGAWMGFGDAKLALGIGWMLPFCMNAGAVMLAFFGGSVFGILVIVISRIDSIFGGKKFGLKSEIPFAPFLIISIFLVFVFNLDVIGYLTGEVIKCVR